MIPMPGSSGSVNQRYRKPTGSKSDFPVTSNPAQLPETVLSSSTSSFTMNAGSFVPNFGTNNTLFSLTPNPGTTITPGFNGVPTNTRQQGRYTPPNTVNDVLSGLGVTGVGQSVSANPIFNSGGNNIFGGGNFQSSIFTMPTTLPIPATQDPLGLNQFSNGMFPNPTGSELNTPFTGITGNTPTSTSPNNSVNTMLKKLITSLLQKRKSDAQKAEAERQKKADNEKARAEQQKADTEKAKADAEKATAEAEKAKAEADRARAQADADAQARARADADARAKADAEARAKADADAKAKAEDDKNKIMNSMSALSARSSLLGKLAESVKEPEPEQPVTAGAALSGLASALKGMTSI